MNKPRLLLALLAVLVLSSFAAAQPSPSQVKRSAEIQRKLRELDILNQVLPILMSKEQIRAVLPSIERARQAVADAQAKEADVLTTLERKVDEALEAAMDEGKVPDPETIKEFTSTFAAFALIRKAVADANVDAVLAAMKENLNSGQIKAAANSLNPAMSDPTLDVSELTDEVKLRYFVRTVMLDPLTYGLLRELAKD